MSLPSHFNLLRQIWTAPGNAGHRVQALRRAVSWFMVRHQKPAPNAPVLTPVFDGQRTYPCHADSIIAKHLMYRSEWFDWDMLHFLQAYLQPGDHFLDVGANIGLHTLLASTRIDPRQGGHITCIEPDPANLTRLRHTLAVNGLEKTVTLHPVAASNAEGSVTLQDSDAFARIGPVAEGADLGHFKAEGADLGPSIANPPRSTRAATILPPVAKDPDLGHFKAEGADLGPSIANPPRSMRAATILPPVAKDPDPGSSIPQSEIQTPNARTTVPAIPLDKLLSGSDTIHACKIDVEGAEWQVLQGAAELISSGRLPCLILEYCGHLDRYGETGDAFLAWLRSQGYAHIGVYDHDRRTLRPRTDADEDIFVFNEAGIDLMKRRLPGLNIRVAS